MGMMSDHAEDQKKLFRLLRDFKQRCERELRGERWVHKHFGENGLLASMTVIEDERTKRYEEGRSAYFHKIGEADFDKLPAEAKVDVDFMLWAGCCMHKEMNAFKGFCTGMEGWWKAKGKDGPIKLYNRDNHATVQTAQGTTAAQRAEDRTKGGAVKLVSLAGAIFRHKDRKRGQQDTLRFFFDAELGFTINFPRPPHQIPRICSRQQGYGKAEPHGAERTRWLPLPQDDPGGCARRSLCTGDQRAVHARDTRPLPFLEKIAADPGLLVNDRVEFETASLDGKLWHDPEAIYAAHGVQGGHGDMAEVLVRVPGDLESVEGEFAARTDGQYERCQRSGLRTRT